MMTAPAPQPDALPEDTLPPAEAPSKLDLKCQEAFPSLGGSSSSKSTTNGKPPGFQKHPFSLLGSAAAAKTTQQQLKQPLHNNKSSERLDIPLDALVKKHLGKDSPLSQVCKSIMDTLQVQMDLSTSKRTGTLSVLLTGPKDKVPLAKRQLLSQVTVHVSLLFEPSETCVLGGGFM
jgi:hypothetical protein